MTLDPAVAAVRLAVRRYFGASSDWGDPVLVACSGGADSLALLAACVFEGRKGGVSRHRGDRRPRAAGGLGGPHGAGGGADGRSRGRRDRVDPGHRRPGVVGDRGRCPRGEVRRPLPARRRTSSPTLVLLGHTLDDQAETVLLGLARGSGGRSLQGMRGYFRDPEGVGFARPLLGLTRAQTEAACRAEGIEWWEDPQNADPRFARSRVRHTVMPMLERELGPGIAEALARTGEQLRDDMDFMEPFELDGLRTRPDRRRHRHARDRRRGRRDPVPLREAGRHRRRAPSPPSCPAPTCSPYSDCSARRARRSSSPATSRRTPRARCCTSGGPCKPDSPDAAVGPLCGCRSGPNTRDYPRIAPASSERVCSRVGEASVGVPR